MEPGINEATPIVYKGVMYLGNPNDVIQAIDAATGELLWQYRRNLPSLQQFHNDPWGQRKRSVFLYDDKVYTVTRDNFLLALDAKTGKELWEVNRGGDLYATNTNGPIVVDGVVIAGGNCQEAPFGCFVTGNDAKTGKELWRNYLIPKPGEPGDKSGARCRSRSAGSPACGAPSPMIRSWTWFTTAPAAPAPAPTPSAAMSAPPWMAPTPASPSNPGPARSCGSIRCCRATIGIRNAPSR